MNNNKKDYLLHTLFFQFLVCAVTFGILFGIKLSGINITDNLKKAYFDNLERNYIAELKESGVSAFNTIPESAVTEISATITESESEAQTTEPLTNAETAQVELTANIKAEGGADYSVSDENEIPANVSVNSYTLNQKIFTPAKGEITSDFGIRTHPLYGDLRFHAGIDIANDTGTPVYAAFDGKVIVASYDEWNGYYIKISHDNEIMTVYCHCNELFVNVGDIVKSGQKIAEMGSTGSSTGPHLHFELRIKNISYDPEIVLNEAVDGT